MKYPNRIQAALLFDQPFDGLDDVARDFARLVEMKTGSTFNVPEHKPGMFLRLFGGGRTEGGGEMIVTFELLTGPGAMGVYDGALGSSITGILCPDIRQRVMRARCHIQLDVSHGVLGGVEEDPKVAPMLSQLGVDQLWSTQAAFHTRLETLALMARVTADHITPSVIHWTQSNQLLDLDTFEKMAGPAASMSFPSPLTIHPILFGEPDADGVTSSIGLRTLGARHWLGREIVVPATTLPWAAAYQTAVAFCSMATMEGGYVIPDGNTFGPEDGSEAWRVYHREAGVGSGSSDDIATYELVPLRHDGSGFVADDYASEARITQARNTQERGTLTEDTGADAEPEFVTTPAPAAIPIPAAIETVQSVKEASPDDQEAVGGPPEMPAPEPIREISTPVASKPGDAQISGSGLRARLFGDRRA